MIAGGGSYSTNSFSNVVDIFDTTNANGINESSVKNCFTVWPNPVNDKLNISFDENSIVGTINIFAINGQKQSEIKLTENKMVIDVSTLSNGIYFLKFVNGSTVEIKKIVKG